jgi:hypothetical protein
VTLAATADWANVAVALLVGLPGIISAIYAARVHHQIKTPSKLPIGQQVENNLHTGLANNYRLRSISDAVQAPESAESHTEAEKVPDLPEGNGEPTAGP